MKKWIRLNASVFKLEKLDVAIHPEDVNGWQELLEFACREEVRLSLRVTDLDDNVLSMIPAMELLDMFLCPLEMRTASLKRFICRGNEEGISSRVQILVCSGELPGIEDAADCLKGAASVCFCITDSFSCDTGRIRMRVSQERFHWMNRLAHILVQQGVDVTLLGIPYCLVEEENHAYVLGGRQVCEDHGQYARASLNVALKAYQCGLSRTNLIMDGFLSSRQGRKNLADNVLLPWVFGHPRIEARLWLLHRLTRYLGISQRMSGDKVQTIPGVALTRLPGDFRRQPGKICSICRFQRICERNIAFLHKICPEASLRPYSGKPMATVEVLRGSLKRYYDAVDQKRLHLPGHLRLLGQEALRIIRDIPPSREIPLDSYAIENHYNPRDDASKRWYSLSTGEMLSTILARLAPPFTLMMTFGGGIAEQIGFSFGRHAKIVCPMIDYSHKITLHVDRQGYYALLRDGIQVRPAEFAGVSRVPERLSGILEPRISIHNVDGMILTQTLLLWQDLEKIPPDTSRIKYSVIIVSTRYARRLQAALLALAHQNGILPGCIEVVVAYVPGVDATDDLLDAMECAFPGLRIVRSPFSRDHVRSKGFMINESLHAASGKWIVIMDADIVVPPDMFAQMEAHSESSNFIAPDGRKMLSPESTSSILLGEIRPWENFAGLSAAVTDVRYREGEGIPCGFFQCVRREILENIPYQESDHFEGADWYFARDAIERYGRETRLEGTYVLHLDHGGRQWYGTEKQR